MNITIIGSGYVGLVTGACLAELGNKVICCDNDAEKIKGLKKGRMPIYEPGLQDLVKANIRKKKLSFTGSIKEAVRASELIFIAVGTPSLKNGEPDLAEVERVAGDIAANMTSYRLVIEKSTVPIATGERIKEIILKNLKRKIKFDVVSNPEFLREGQAIYDFMHPPRIVIGIESKKAKETMVNLYKPLNTRLFITDIKSAELIKHASNSFLVMKISFINSLANVCERTGADILEVAEGIGLDPRIGKAFLNAGIGYGGPCLPKDLDALIKISEKAGYEFRLLQAAKEANQGQREYFLEKILYTLGSLQDKSVGILGLSYKPNTDDMRHAPSIPIIEALSARGLRLKAYDPEAMKKAKEVLGNKVEFCNDPYQACRGSDCLLILTEWDEFKELDFAKVKKLMKKPLIIDGRNIYEPQAMQKAGFTYIGIGRRV